MNNKHENLQKTWSYIWRGLFLGGGDGFGNISENKGGNAFKLFSDLSSMCVYLYILFSSEMRKTQQKKKKSWIISIKQMKNS